MGCCLFLFDCVLVLVWLCIGLVLFAFVWCVCVCVCLCLGCVLFGCFCFLLFNFACDTNNKQCCIFMFDVVLMYCVLVPSLRSFKRTELLFFALHAPKGKSCGSVLRELL